MTENKNVETILKNGDKALSGMPYLYRSKGLPSEVYDVRMREDINGELLKLAIADTVIRYPYFGVKFIEKDGDFYAVRNEMKLEAHHKDGFIPLGGHSNNYHLMGVTYWEKSLKLSFHHGLTDGRGAKTFLETLLRFYSDYKNADMGEYEQIREEHHLLASELSVAELTDPCEKKYELNGKSMKIEGLSNKGYKLPETKNKDDHRRYEISFSQKQFMDACKSIGASPITYLSILMSRGIKEISLDCDKTIVSNFPMDARHILGCDDTFKNCVKSMTLPYGREEENLSDSEIAAKYKRLLNAQKEHDHCAKEFNNINMLLSVIGHFHSFAGRQKLLGFMENLALDTYLISYIGQFDMPGELVDEVHLYSNCSSGLVLNMTCQSGKFIIDLTQDFSTDKYVNALRKQFEKAGIDLVVSDEIIFETPFDELSEIITSPADTGEQVRDWLDKFVAAAKASSQAAKERAEAAKNMNPQITALYYDAASGTMKSFDPTKNTQEEMQKLVENAPSLFIS